jgi:hypothetical protein
MSSNFIINLQYQGFHLAKIGDVDNYIKTRRRVSQDLRWDVPNPISQRRNRSKPQMAIFVREIGKHSQLYPR